MNYFGNFDAKVSGALGQYAPGHVESTTVHATHVPSDAIVVPDAQLLFGAEFKRTGVDLVLSGDGREFVLHDYFKGEKHAPLASPDGAHLTGDLVNALAGQVQYAQADGNAAAGQVIGHVTKLAGTATAIRNGVSIILNNGDNVEKGDVVASGSNSTVGITFIDGTVFGLSSNARMVLNEMVYDPNGSNNSSLLSLVAGTITFVAGETAKHGDMKVDTPVATMGIRGTAVLCEIDFSVPGTTPDAKFQVLVEPDGTTGSYILFDKTTLTPLAVVDQAGMQINISNGIMSQTLAPLSPEIQKLITDVFSLKFTDSTNTKSLQNFTDSIVPNALGFVKFALGAPPPVGPIIVNLQVENTAAAPAPATPIQHIAQAPNFQNGPALGDVTEKLLITGSNSPQTVSGQLQYFDINTSDHDTVSVKFASFTYQNAKGQDITGSLNSLQLADILNVEAAVTVSKNTGPNTIGNGTANWSYSVADKAFDFLAAGEKLTLTYTATVDNNYAPIDQTGSTTITITVTGTNDAPVITSSQQNIAFTAAGTGTHGGDLLPDTATKGTLAFKDADLTDTHTVAVKMTSALLDGQSFAATVGPNVINELAAAVTVSIPTGDDSTLKGTGTIDWALANLQISLADLVPAGESLVLTYAVTVTDSQGATATQDIVVTIGGNNGAAVVWDDTSPIPPGGALWSIASNWEGDRVPNTDGFNDDVFIGTDQVLPATPTFPATINDAEAAKSLTMDYFTDFGTSIPELDVLSTGTLTISGALNMGTSADPASPLTAETIIKNFGTISVGGVATLLKHSVLDNYGTITLAQGGLFGDQSSITNSGTIEVVSDTLDIEVAIANFVTTTVDESPVTTPGLIQIDGGATLKLSDGATITKGDVTLGNLSLLDVENGTASLPAGTPDATLDGVTVTGTSGSTPSTIEIGTLGAATLLLDGGTIIKNGDLTIASGSALDITTSGATLDGVNVTGTIGAAGAMLGGLDAGAGVSIPASTIEVGTATATGTVLTLDDGTTITNGNLIIDSGNTLEIAKGTATLASGTPDAALDTVDVTNSGTIQIDVPATLTLNGTTVSGGGSIDDAGTLSVTGSSSIEGENIYGGGDVTVAGGQTLTLSAVTLDDVTLSGSFTNADTLTIDQTVKLSDATISGGTIDDTGTLSVTTSSKIESATVDGGGDVTVVSGQTLTLSGVTLDDVTLAGSFANADTLTIDGTVTLNGATISGGTIDDTGTLASLTQPSTIENATVDGGGNLTGEMTFSGVTLDDVTLTGIFVNSDTLTIDGTVTIEGGGPVFGGTIDDTGTLSIVAGLIGGATIDGGGDVTSTGTSATLETVTLDDVTLSGSFIVSDTLTIDGTVALDGVTFSGSPIDDTGTLLITASSEIDGLIVDGGGDLTVTGGTLTLSDVTLENLTLSGSFTNSNTLIIEGTDTLNGATISGGTIDDIGALLVTAASEIENATVNGGEVGDITVTGGTLTLSGVTLDGSNLSGSFKNLDTLTIDETVTLNGATISGGTIADTGTLSVSASSEIENTTVNGGGDLTVAGGQTLTLSGVTLDDVTLAGSFANLDTLTIDETVTLNGATISGGTIADTGTLSVSASSEIENATVNGGGEIRVASGTLTLSDVTLDDVTLSGSFANADTLTIKDTVTLNGATISGGTIDDTGTLSINGSSLLENVTIDGGGDLTATSGEPRLAGVTLDDVTLAGSFSDFNATLTIDGTVTLNGATISGGTFGGLIDNDGTLLVTASSEIDHVNIDDGGHITVTGGTLTFGPSTTLNGGTLTGSFSISQELSVDGTVTLDGATISGGTIKDTGTLLVTASSEIENATVDGGGDVTVTGGTLTLAAVTLDDVTLAGSFANSGTLTIKDTVTLNGATLNGGAIADIGTLSVIASSEIENATVNGGGDLTVTGGQTLTLSGVTLDDVTLAGSVTNSDKLTIKDTVKLNGGTISGGTISDIGTLSITASSEIENATVNGGGDLTVIGGTLTLATVTLDNVMLAGSVTNSGMLTIDDTVTFNGGTITGGTLDVVGELDTTGTSFITDATIINRGNIHIVSGALTIDPTPFTNLGLFEVSGALTLSGEIFTNSGTVGNSTINGTLQIDQGGTLTLENSTINGGIVSNSGTIHVTADSSIEDTFSFVNTGTVNSDGAELNLIGMTVNNSGGTFRTTGKGILGLENATINSGTLGGAIATIAGNAASTLNGATLAFGTLVTAAVGVLELTGTIFTSGEIDATTGTVDLSNATIMGGTFGGDGTIVTVSHFNTFKGVTIADGTTVSVADGTTLDLAGAISDAGTIALGASGHLTGLEISGNVSLSSGGNVTMTNDTHNFIASDGSAATLTNSDTISGAGTIGDSHLTLVNNGTIDATGSHALIIDTGVNSLTFDGLVGNLLVTNNVGGVLEASAGHTLLIEDNVLNNGLIQSGNPGSNSGAFVDVTGNITGTGSIEIFNNSTVEIGGSVSSGQTVTFGAPGGPVANNGLLILQDSHDFHGTIAGLTENQNESLENQVDLQDLAYLGPLLTHAHFNHSNDTVTVSDLFDFVTLNVSGNSSGSFEVSFDGHGGTLLQDPAASGNVTVESGQTLEISAASSVTVDFTNSNGNTGALVLDDSKDFTGEVVGFTGDGTTANSDLIDVTDISIADVATNKTTYADHGNGTGTLTLYNASGQALDSIDFTGSYQLANFTIENDGNGGTLIVDPPVKTGDQTPGSPIVAPNHDSAGTAVPDGFVFNFAGHNHAPAPDFHPDWDSFRPGGSMLTNLHTAANAAPDQGYSGEPAGSDGHDHLGVAGFVKAHLNSSDFHFV